jgi:AAA family ATP:ADP antiporter
LWAATSSSTVIAQAPQIRCDAAQRASSRSVGLAAPFLHRAVMDVSSFVRRTHCWPIDPDRRAATMTGFAPAAVLFAILVAHSLLETARDALFLAQLGPSRLAFAYLAMAAVTLLAVALIRQRGRLHDPRRMLIGFLCLAVVGTAVLAATVALAASLTFVLYVWTGFVATLVVPCFWTAIDRRTRVADAKQVFGIIGAGGVLGAVVGSAVASLLGRFVEARFLVAAGAIAFGFATMVAVALVPRGEAEKPSARRARADLLSHQSRRYVRRLLVVGVLATVVLTLGDLTFKRVLAERIPASSLAPMFGAIYAALNALALAIQVLVTPRVLARWGVGATLTVLPLIVVASALGFAATGATIAVLALKLGDGGLRHSLHRVGSEILYLPVPSAVRDGWKLVADAIGQRGGQAIAAMIVVALAAFGASARNVGVVIALGSGCWLVAIIVVRRAYISQFRHSLQAGEIQRDIAIPELDAHAIELLTQSLSSHDEIEAVVALDLLASRARVPALVLYHRSDAVVRHALSLLEGDLRPDVARALDHLLAHPDPRIRAAALAASSRTGSARDRLVAAKRDPAAEVRAVALVVLGDDAAAVAALVAGSPADRLALADAIAFSPSERFRDVLDQLLAADEPAVIRQVLRALARAPALAALDRLVGLLDDARVRDEVQLVFLAAGRRGLAHLIAALGDPRTPLGVRRHVPRTISRFRSPAATAALAARLPDEPDGTTELRILRALGRMRFDDPALAIDPAPLREYIRRAVRDAARYVTLADQLVSVDDRASMTAVLIHELLVEKYRWAVEHAFRALGVLRPEAGLRGVHDAIAGGDEGRRGAAREIVEAIAPSDVRAALLAIIDELPREERRARLGALASGPFARYDDYVAALLADPSESLRCVVAYHVAERRLVALHANLTRLRGEAAPSLVTDVFDRALARLDA